MLEIDSQTVILLSNSIVLQALPELEQFYAFNVETGDHFKLNSSACWLLTIIGRGITFNGLLQVFSQEYKISEEVAKKDVKEILNYSLNNTLITLQEDSS